MSMNNTPSSERLHIGFFGKRNAGKSSLVNSIAKQEVSVVSDIKGTTTDPVKKAIELHPLGPVVLIDTPGFDDNGTLGEMRVKKSREILSKTDIAILVVDASVSFDDTDKELISLFEAENIPFVIVYNKCDLAKSINSISKNEIQTNAINGQNIEFLIKKIAELASTTHKNRALLDGVIKKGDTVILVTPIDESAPKGRLILPQQMTLRNLLDNDCTAIVCKETELKKTLDMLTVKPDLVITDSQVFSYVSSILPDDIRLTSFSIIMARYKGSLKALINGVEALRTLKDGDHVLISEGCSHRRQCNDIGTVKMPDWIREYSGKEISFDFTNGNDFCTAPEKYRLIIHCGGCMLNDKEMSMRIKKSANAGVPMLNYGIAIAEMNGILQRCLEIFINEL